MPYELRDRPGTDGFETPSADVKLDAHGGTDERRVEVGSRQVEQLLEMLGKLAVSPHVHNKVPLPNSFVGALGIKFKHWQCISMSDSVSYLLGKKS